MTDKVTLHIPVYTENQKFIALETSKRLSKKHKLVVLRFEEVLKLIDGEIVTIPVSVIQVYIESVTDRLLDFFKDLTVIVSEQIEDSVLLEVDRKTSYIGTSEVIER